MANLAVIELLVLFLLFLCVDVIAGRLLLASELEEKYNMTLDPRHVYIDAHGRRLATHRKEDPAELESEMVCTKVPWIAARRLSGWCGPRYPPNYKPCRLCFINNWCSPGMPWFGITCNGGMSDGRVIRIEFEGKGIGGPVYRNFPYFTDLEKIGLLSNRLVGNIPGNIGGCAGLTHISLDKNNLVGNVPGSLGGLEALTYLNVGNNKLGGALSAALGGLSSIRFLYFNNNKFNGPIPASFGDMRSVSILRLDVNQLSGVVPDSLCQLQQTVIINTQYNYGLTCYPQCMAKISGFERDNDSRKGKVLCCCEDCSYVEVTQNEREFCPPTWPTQAPFPGLLPPSFFEPSFSPVGHPAQAFELTEEARGEAGGEEEGGEGGEGEEAGGEAGGEEEGEGEGGEGEEAGGEEGEGGGEEEGGEGEGEA
jgi:hypothetical protein